MLVSKWSHISAHTDGNGELQPRRSSSPPCYTMVSHHAGYPESSTRRAATTGHRWALTSGGGIQLSRYPPMDRPDIQLDEADAHTRDRKPPHHKPDLPPASCRGLIPYGLSVPNHTKSHYGHRHSKVGLVIRSKYMRLQSHRVLPA